MGGLPRSEFHTLSLPFRVMDEQARNRLLDKCLPLSAAVRDGLEGIVRGRTGALIAHQAHRWGLVDYLLPDGIGGCDLTDWITEFANRHRRLALPDDLQHWRSPPTKRTSPPCRNASCGPSTRT